MTVPSDELLLGALRRAFADPGGEPSEAELEAFRALLTSSAAVPLRRRRRARAVASALVAAAAAVTVLLALVPLPSPLRSIAVSIGLPVNDAHVAAVKGEIGALAVALTGNDRTAIAARSRQLRREVAGLSATDRAKVEPAARRLLGRAERALEPAPHHRHDLRSGGGSIFPTGAGGARGVPPSRAAGATPPGSPATTSVPPTSTTSTSTSTSTSTTTSMTTSTTSTTSTTTSTTSTTSSPDSPAHAETAPAAGGAGGDGRPAATPSREKSASSDPAKLAAPHPKPVGRHGRAAGGDRSAPDGTGATGGDS